VDRGRVYALGSASCVRPKCQDDIGVTDLRELMALLGEVLNVFSEGFARLMPTTLQVPRVVELHIHAMEVACDDLLEILPAIDHVSW
jgi:hypothetical protein